MPYGYTGQNLINQTVKNSGVFSISDVADLTKQGKFGGSLELIEEQTASNAVVDFTNLKNYDVHLVQYSDILLGSNTAGFRSRLSNDGGTSFISTGYQYAIQYAGATGGFGESKSTNDDSFPPLAPSGNATNIKKNGYVYYYNLLDSNKYSFCTTHNTSMFSSFYQCLFGGGVLPTAETHNAIRFTLDGGGTITSGTIKLYGVKQI